MIEKKCMQTGISILSGRSDKKFIDDKARSRYHYNKRREKARVYNKIDKQMHLNDEILEIYYEETKGEKGILLSYLKAWEFDPTIYFGPRISPDSEYRPTEEYLSYNYKYTYDRETKKITIQKIQRRLMKKY